MEIPLQEALFPISREVHPCCKPWRLTVFHSEDIGDVSLRNVGSYKKHMASSYPRRQHSSRVKEFKISMGMDVDKSILMFKP
jgi:hypothetical protein